MIAFALLIPPALLASVMLLSRFEERMFALPRPAQPVLRLVVGELEELEELEEPGELDAPLTAEQAA